MPMQSQSCCKDRKGRNGRKVQDLRDTSADMEGFETPEAWLTLAAGGPPHTTDIDRGPQLPSHLLLPPSSLITASA